MGYENPDFFKKSGFCPLATPNSKCVGNSKQQLLVLLITHQLIIYSDKYTYKYLSLERVFCQILYSDFQSTGRFDIPTFPTIKLLCAH